MNLRIDHYFHLEDASLLGKLDHLTDLVVELKEIFMSGAQDILREVAEEKETLAKVSAALTGLVGVVVPLQAQLTEAQAALVAAQDALAAANASSAELDAQLAAAATGLNDGQTAIQTQLDAIPPATP